LADERGAVVEQAVHRDRQADERRKREVPGLLEKFGKRVFRRLDQRLLVEQVVAGVGGQAEPRERPRAPLSSRAAWRISSTVEARLYCGSPTRTSGVATAARTNPWR
jgi:hypothetical protein